MHYALLTYGSMGDVRPFAALALGLQRNGQRVTLAAPENFKDFIENLGIPFFPLAGNLEARVNDPQMLKVLRSGNNLSFLIGLLKAGDDLRLPVLEGLLQLSRQADVLLTSTLNIFYVDAIAECLHKPWAMLLPSPPMTETGEFPFPDFDCFNFPWYNRLTYRLTNFAFWQVYKKRACQFRASLGLPDPPGNPLRAYAKGKAHVLYIFSPQLIRQPMDWNDNCRITGYCSLDEHAPPDSGLAAWLQSAAAPLYIGFGSIPIPDPALVARCIRYVLERTNQRIVYCKGWSELPLLAEHPRLRIIDRADHRWLLPQCRAAIHHGGAGTTNATLKAGIPSIILSIFGDQPQWGKIVQRRGVGIHLPFRRLSPRRLFHAIEKATAPPILQQAAMAGRKDDAGDGVTITVEALSSFFNKSQ